MTNRNYIKCDVCGSIILVRTQVGHLIEHPIRINCAKCGILISGTFKQDPVLPRFNITFRNAVEVGMQDPDYYIEVSGELLTSKIRPFEKDKDEYPLPPFFNSLQAMKNPHNRDNPEDAFFRFMHGYLDFLRFIEKDWPLLRRLHELWLAEKDELLAAQLRNKLSINKFPLNNKLEYLRGIHELYTVGFRSALPTSIIENTPPAFQFGINELSRTNPAGFLALTEFFNNNGMLREFEERILTILNSYIDRYPFFITTIGLESYQTTPDLNRNGTTTTTFDDVKHFYLDCFETIGDIIPLVIAYNNLKYRSDSFLMAESPAFPKIKTLQNYVGMRNKGNKILFCTSSEFFNVFIDLDADNGLRNAIGHGSYSYDGVNQIISYYSSGEKGAGEEKKIFLIEFIQRSLAQFYSIIALNELIYQTRQSYFVQHGIAPSVPLSIDKDQKNQTGRNAPCPCGSGKKYKKCCGLK